MTARLVAPPQQGMDSDVALIQAGLDWLSQQPEAEKFLALNGMPRMLAADDFERFRALSEVVGKDQFEGLSEFQEITHGGAPIRVVGPEFAEAIGSSAALVVYPEEDELTTMEGIGAFSRVAVIPWSEGDVAAWKEQHAPQELDWP